MAVICLSAGTVNANNIELLNFQCLPCIAYGGWYCFDDPWQVNFNGDKCYEHAVDRVACPFNFTNNVSSCFGTILQESSSCEVLKEKFMHYRLPMSFSIDLEPRSSCGVSVYAYSALLQTAHKYPVTMYHTWGD